MPKNPPLQIIFAGRLTIALAGCTIANIKNSDIANLAVIANAANAAVANPCHLG